MESEARRQENRLCVNTLLSHKLECAATQWAIRTPGSTAPGSNVLVEDLCAGVYTSARSLPWHGETVNYYGP